MGFNSAFKGLSMCFNSRHSTRGSWASAATADNDLIRILKICPNFGGLNAQKLFSGIFCQVYLYRMFCILMHPLWLQCITNKQKNNHTVRHTTALPSGTPLHCRPAHHCTVTSLYIWNFIEIIIPYPVSSCLSYVQHYSTTALQHCITTVLQQYNTAALQH